MRIIKATRAYTLLVFIAATAVVLSAQAVQASAIESSYDRFTGTTTLSTSIRHAVSVGSPVSVFFQAVVSKDSSISILRLAIIRSSQDLKYASCQQVHFLVNGEPLELESEYAPRVDQGVFEVFIVTLTPDTLLKLSNAQKVEYKICNDEFSMSAEVLGSGKEIYDYLVASGAVK